MVVDVTTAMSLYPSSSTTFCSASHISTTCPVVEADFSARIATSHNAGSKHAVSGLAGLFKNSNARQITTNGYDQLDLAAGSNPFVRGSCSDSSVIDSLSIASPSVNGKVKEWSPVSVLQGPFACYSTSQCSHCSAKPLNSFSLVEQHARSALRAGSSTLGPQLLYSWQMDLQDTYNMPEEHLGSFSPPQQRVTEASGPLLVDSRKTAEEILQNAQACHEIFNDRLVTTAFYVAEKAHCAKYRASGELCLVHCVETAKNLASLGATKEIVAAGLLHDIGDESPLDDVELQEVFGKPVAEIIEGVSKMSELSKLARDNDIASRSIEADRLHTMFLAMADVRVVVVKLADRLHNMRTLEALPEHKRTRIAKETLQIFVPLANRLGIWSWKAELEDLCFKQLKPQEHQKLAEKLSEGNRESTIAAAIQKLERNLLEEGILFSELTGRPKNLFGIYTKMLRKCKDLDDVHDLQGLRLILSSKEDCYTALDIVHRLWPQASTRVKDYIAEPKANGYQSLHAIVQGEDGFPLEIQIRTEEMHYQAELGVAAHWRYKEENVEHSPFILQMVAWARLMLTWRNEILETKSRFPLSNCSLDSACHFPNHRDMCPHMQLEQVLPWKEDDPLYVIVLEDDKMEVQELPGGSTVSDLIHRRETEDAFAATCGLAFLEEVHPRVNHKTVDDIQQVLKMGDLVELTSSIPDESLIECRNTIKRMYGDTEQDSRHAVQLSS